jgi:hypothetical protein
MTYHRYQTMQLRSTHAGWGRHDAMNAGESVTPTWSCRYCGYNPDDDALRRWQQPLDEAHAEIAAIAERTRVKARDTGEKHWHAVAAGLDMACLRLTEMSDPSWDRPA